MSPNKARMELLEKLIKDFKVDAVVDLVLQACHTYNVETAMVKKLVKDKMGIPYTVVETDYSQADVGQIQPRLPDSFVRFCTATSLSTSTSTSSAFVSALMAFCVLMTGIGQVSPIALIVTIILASPFISKSDYYL